MSAVDLIMLFAPFLQYVGLALMLIGTGYNIILYITAETPQGAEQAKSNLIKTFIGGLLIYEVPDLIKFIIPSDTSNTEAWKQVIQNVINLLWWIALALISIMTIWTGIKILTSENPYEQANAKTQLIRIIIGATILIGAVEIIKWFIYSAP
jgi:hypothetical protein